MQGGFRLMVDVDVDRFKWRSEVMGGYIQP